MRQLRKLTRFLAGVVAWAGWAPGVIAQGIRKQTVIGKQTGLGVPKTGAGGQILRRETSVFKLDKATYESDEIVSHQQSTGSRHGLQSTTGKLSGLLSPGTYKLLMATALRKDFVVGVNTTAIVTVTAAVTTGASGTFTRSAGSYLTDGFKIGDVVRWTGWTTTGAPNNAHNFVITALTATVMTGTMLDGVAVGAKAAGDSVTGTVTGKKTLAPLTGHTDDIFTVEEFYPDLAPVCSELFSDLRLNQMAFDLPASGNAKVTFDLLGLRRQLFAAQQMTAPAAETTTSILESVQGFLLVNGAQAANVTGLKMTIDEQVTNDGPIVGSDLSPDAARGRIKVAGEFSAYFQDSALQALFAAESVLNLVVVLTADTTSAADFVGVSLGRIKLGGDAPDDGEKGIIRTFPFIAEINTAGGAALANDQTIMSIQDSQA